MLVGQYSALYSKTNFWISIYTLTVLNIGYWRKIVCLYNQPRFAYFFFYFFWREKINWHYKYLKAAAHKIWQTHQWWWCHISLHTPPAGFSRHPFMSLSASWDRDVIVFIHAELNLCSVWEFPFISLSLFLFFLTRRVGKDPHNSAFCLSLDTWMIYPIKQPSQTCRWPSIYLQHLWRLDEIQYKMVFQ